MNAIPKIMSVMMSQICSAFAWLDVTKLEINEDDLHKLQGKWCAFASCSTLGLILACGSAFTVQSRSLPLTVLTNAWHSSEI